jgi:hypothetical protein
MSKASLIVASLLVSTMAAVSNAAAQYQPFPPGYKYLNPFEIKKLNKAVLLSDHKAVRRHGWSLWAGIVQPSKANPKWPIWYTWPNTFAAFAPDTTALQAASNGPRHGMSMIRLNAIAGSSGEQLPPGVFPVNIAKTPVYPIPDPVKAAYPNATKNCISKDNPENICDGAHFLFNGDIMIPTESLSREGFNWIRQNKLYERKTLYKHLADGDKNLPAPKTYIVTKHMYWPVKAGQISAIPVWHNYHDASYPDYAGYETWPKLVGVDPSGRSVGKTVSVSYLHGVLQPDGTTSWPTTRAEAKVYGLNDFYYHQVTAADWASFDEADKAILNASSYWAYDKPFGPGDYLVTIAMHINTKEIPTWALQSVWWSDVPDAGPYAADRPHLPQAKGPWRHYLLIDAYGITTKPHGKELPVATNPYIELVIHPVGTDCNNCHIRAGWPPHSKPPKPGESSYQNPDCPVLLRKLSPGDPCLNKLLRTDFQWIITDRALPPPP